MVVIVLYHERLVIFWTLLDLDRSRGLLEYVHLDSIEACPLLDLPYLGFVAYRHGSVDAVQVEWASLVHEGQDVLMPLALENDLQHGDPLILEEVLAKERLPILVIHSLDLLGLVLVEDMLLEPFKCLVGLGADLARVLAINLDPDVCAIIQSAVLHVPLHVSLRLELSVALWTLQVVLRVPLWVLPLLLP